MGEEEDQDHDGDGEEGDHGEVSRAGELDIAIDAVGIVVEGVQALHDDGDNHRNTGDDQDIEGLKRPRKPNRPTQARKRRSQHALRKKQIYNEEEQDPRRDEDLRCNGNPYVIWVTGPCDAHGIRDETGHAEAECHGGGDEFVAAAVVALEEGHVGYSRGEEEEEEDGADGDVEVFCWTAA